jgi:Trypsin
VPVPGIRPLAIVLWLVCLLGSPPAGAIVYQSTAAQSAGLGTGQAFLDGEAKLVTHFSNGANAGCSGSLLQGSAYLLTAAHCVTGASGTWTTNFVDVSFANSPQYARVTDILVAPLWNGDLFGGNDLALLRLPSPITSINGYPLYTAASAFGQTVFITGYGDTGLGQTGNVNGSFGTLYYGRNIYDVAYVDNLLHPLPLYGFDFDQFPGAGAVGEDEVMIAPGDSGGGTFLNIGGTYYLVGVHSFILCTSQNCTPNSTFGQYGGDSTIYTNQAWLLAVLPEPAGALLIAPALLTLAALQRSGGRFPSPSWPAIRRA